MFSFGNRPFNQGIHFQVNESSKELHSATRVGAVFNPYFFPGF